MLTKENKYEWMVEPGKRGAREYARLSVIAEVKGLNVDGQALIPWAELHAAETNIKFADFRAEENKKARYAAR